jgi:hypothetical protein
MEFPIDIKQVRFGGRHRCPRCRMPLHAEEIVCPVCALDVVFIAEDGQVMVEMIANEAPGEWTRELSEEYLTMLKVERAGDMYLGPHHFPTRPQHAQLSVTTNGHFLVGFSNRVELADVRVVR